VENLAKRGPLATVRGPLANTQKKNLLNDDESGCGYLYQIHKSPENNPKNAKNNNLLKTKRILKPKYKYSEVQFSHLACQEEGQSASLHPVSYDTDCEIMYLYRDITRLYGVL